MRLKLLRLFLLIVILTSLSLSVSSEEPIKIENFQELQEINDNLGSDYVIVDEINVPREHNFEPIGSCDYDYSANECTQDAFSGTLDGGNHTISGLEIQDNEEVGLFSGIGKSGIIQNLNLNSVNIEGNRSVGAVAGHNDGLIQNVNVSGVVNGEEWVGGVAGRQHGYTGLNEGNATVKKVSMDGDVTGASAVGGLVGRSLAANILQGSINGAVEGQKHVGGLVGSTKRGAEISNSASYGEVIGEEEVGGISGRDTSTIYNVTSESTVTGETSVGGIVGRQAGDINHAYSAGNIKGINRVGGAIGSKNARPDASNISSSSDVDGETKVGGIVGRMSGTLKSSYASGDVSGTSEIGGIAGNLAADDIVDANYTGNVSGETSVGGIVGSIQGHADYREAGVQDAKWQAEDPEYDAIGTINYRSSVKIENVEPGEYENSHISDFQEAIRSYVSQVIWRLF